MKKLVTLLMVVLFGNLLFAGSATIIFLNGKKVKGKIVKVEAGEVGAEYKGTAYALTVAEGTAELRIPLEEIKVVQLKSQADVSCFEDGTMTPIRKFCTARSTYNATLQQKKGKKGKRIAEVVDERMFYFYFEGKKEPVQVIFAKIKVSNAGKEGSVGYPDLEQKVLKMQKAGVKKIIFSK
ncbi:hypothetical protein KAH37_06000 [bacterium]|nr:hypothetical protein [bacterium]